MPNREPLSKRLANFFTVEAALAMVQAALKPLTPYAVAAITAVSGYLNDLPLWVLLPFIGIAFMTTISSINNWDQMATRRELRDKFLFIGLRVEQAYEPHTQDQGYTITLLFRNTGDVALEYVCTEFSAVMEERQSREGRLPTNRVMVPAKSEVHYKSGLIATGYLARKTTAIKAHVAFDYGRVGGRLRHQLRQELVVVFETDAQGKIDKIAAYNGGDDDERYITTLRQIAPSHGD